MGESETRETEAPAGGWSELMSAEQGPRLALVCLGVWLHAADELVAATMTPFIVADIGGAELVAWIFALYETGSIVAGACGALIALRFGLAGPMSAAALLFAGGCLTSALAPSMETMLGGRVLQGLGGGGLLSMSFIAVGALFAPAQMPRVMAAMSALWGTAAFLGPLIGGLFADAGLWRGAYWFFGAQALLLAALIASRARLLTIRRDALTEEAPSRIPALRLAALAGGVVAVSAAGLSTEPLEIGALFGLGAGLLWLFFRIDARRGPDAMLPSDSLDIRRPLGAALVMVMAFCVATISFSIYGPILFTGLHGLSALHTGYLIALSSIGWSAAAIVSAGAAERYDRWLIRAGMALLCLSIAGFLAFAVSGPIWLIAALAFLEGAGFGIAWTFILRRTQALAPAEQKERMASALPMAQRLGYAIGAALAGVVANAAGFADDAPRPVVEAVGFWVFAAALPVAALGLIAAWRFTWSAR